MMVSGWKSGQYNNFFCRTQNLLSRKEPVYVSNCTGRFDSHLLKASVLRAVASRRVPRQGLQLDSAVSYIPTIHRQFFLTPW